MPSTISSNLLLIVALAPLVGAVVAGLGGNVVGRKGSHRITILGVLVSFIASAVVLKQVVDGARFNATVYEWMVVGGLKMEIGFLVDGLTAMMMAVVSFVSLMVHIYTIGYMEDDDGYQRFFAYISLFTFSMLMLVMSNNFLQLFFGWEAVGLVSYLLIGFWFKRPTAIFANLKAFVVNRVGDFGFILGIGLIVTYAGTLSYAEAFAKGGELAKMALPGTEWMLITVICICLFIGAMGKSAQFPLHVWLPDSMEGPTPISALIHAATMVTAGIFMVARMSPLFELSDTALNVVLVIGAITALFMGFLGVVQNDIKRVVAYSTLSQLGYMTVALGVSAYSVAVFHLMTHAFFKALLFLAAGSVIIGMHHDQDIRNMGGLAKYMRDHLDHVAAGLAGADRHAVVRRLLLQGLDHRGGARQPVAGCGVRDVCRHGRRVRHRLLLVPHVLPGVPRPGALPPQAVPRRTRPPRRPRCRLALSARVAVGGDGAAGGAGHSVGGDRRADDRSRAVRRLLRRLDRGRRHAPWRDEGVGGTLPRRHGDGAARVHARCRSGWPPPAWPRRGGST